MFRVSRATKSAESILNDNTTVEGQPKNVLTLATREVSNDVLPALYSLLEGQGFDTDNISLIIHSLEIDDITGFNSFFPNDEDDSKKKLVYETINSYRINDGAVSKAFRKSISWLRQVKESRHVDRFRSKKLKLLGGFLLAGAGLKIAQYAGYDIAGAVGDAMTSVTGVGHGGGTSGSMGSVAFMGNPLIDQDSSTLTPGSASATPDVTTSGYPSSKASATPDVTTSPKMPPAPDTGGDGGGNPIDSKTGTGQNAQQTEALKTLQDQVTGADKIKDDAFSALEKAHKNLASDPDNKLFITAVTDKQAEYDRALEDYNFASDNLTDAQQSINDASGAAKEILGLDQLSPSQQTFANSTELPWDAAKGAYSAESATNNLLDAVDKAKANGIPAETVWLDGTDPRTNPNAIFSIKVSDGNGGLTDDPSTVNKALAPYMPGDGSSSDSAQTAALREAISKDPDALKQVTDNIKEEAAAKDGSAGTTAGTNSGNGLLSEDEYTTKDGGVMSTPVDPTEAATTKPTATEAPASPTATETTSPTPTPTESSGSPSPIASSSAGGETSLGLQSSAAAIPTTDASRPQSPPPEQTSPQNLNEDNSDDGGGINGGPIAGGLILTGLAAYGGYNVWNNKRKNKANVIKTAEEEAEKVRVREETLKTLTLENADPSMGNNPIEIITAVISQHIEYDGDVGALVKNIFDNNSKSATPDIEISDILLKNGTQEGAIDISGLDPSRSISEQFDQLKLIGTGPYDFNKRFIELLIDAMK